jgi:hypothetical protein
VDLVIDGGRSGCRAALHQGELEPFLARLRAAGGVDPAAPLGSALDGGRLLAQAPTRPPFDALVHQAAGGDPR